MPVPDAVSARQRHNVLVRHRGADDPVTLDAKRDLEVIKLAEHIQHVVDDAPPLSEAQQSMLAGLLRSSS